MVLELNIFLLILGIGAGAFILSFLLSQVYLYIFGALGIFFAGVAPIISGGLVLDRIVSNVTDTITYTVITLSPTDPLMILVSLVLCGTGAIAFIVLAGNPNRQVSQNRTFHY